MPEPVQESLTNVARYAGVQEVTVRIWTDQDLLTIQVQDQGTGFDVEAALDKPTSSGLSGMYERVRLLDGQMTIESTPGNGALVTAELFLVKKNPSYETG